MPNLSLLDKKYPYYVIDKTTSVWLSKMVLVEKRIASTHMRFLQLALQFPKTAMCKAKPNTPERSEGCIGIPLFRKRNLAVAFTYAGLLEHMSNLPQKVS